MTKVADILEILDLKNGLTLAELSMQSGMNATELYDILRSLQTDGDVRSSVQAVMRTVYTIKPEAIE